MHIWIWLVRPLRVFTCDETCIKHDELMRVITLFCMTHRAFVYCVDCRLIDIKKGMNEMTRKTTNAKRNAKSNETPSIVLKTIHDDIMRANANATITTKQMRAKLRVVMNDVHVRNSSWIFTTSQYDVVRAMFDATYRAKIERANKRNAKSNATPRAKRVAQSNDAPIVETTND